ncbi:MAG: ADP-heptose:LPS heptosyltransferase, partial [Pelagibacterales bacterium]|nr:ADP-heptose:LPS heptosyltransferase [Pelagibacterales bacterium]
KINSKYVEEAKKLLPNNNYIGFSITQGNVYRKKEWPIKNVVDICNKLKEKNIMPVFFVEKENNDLKNKINKLIPNAIIPEHESNLSSPALVACLGRRLKFAISIDNGVMHMLSLTKTPMIVLFGPTNSEKFAPNYKNLIVLDSKKIKKTSDISSIKVEDVLMAARQHLNF